MVSSHIEKNLEKKCCIRHTCILGQNEFQVDERLSEKKHKWLEKSRRSPG